VCVSVTLVGCVSVTTGLVCECVCECDAGRVCECDSGDLRLVSM